MSDNTFLKLGDQWNSFKIWPRMGRCTYHKRTRRGGCRRARLRSHNVWRHGAVLGCIQRLGDRRRGGRGNLLVATVAAIEVTTEDGCDRPRAWCISLRKRATVKIILWSQEVKCAPIISPDTPNYPGKSIMRVLGLKNEPFLGSP